MTVCLVSAIDLFFFWVNYNENIIELSCFIMKGWYCYDCMCELLWMKLLLCCLLNRGLWLVHCHGFVHYWCICYMSIFYPFLVISKFICYFVSVFVTMLTFMNLCTIYNMVNNGASDKLYFTGIKCQKIRVCTIWKKLRCHPLLKLAALLTFPT